MAAVVFVCTQTPLAQTKAPAVINLRDYGWETPEPLHPHEIDTVSGHSILVDHKGQVFVAFPVRERNGLVTQEQPTLSYHVIRFTPDGKVNLSLSLPANGWRNNSIYLSDTDQLIVRANDNLQLFQSDAKTENGSWTVISACAMRCQIYQSPSRRTLLLYTWDVSPPVTAFDFSQLPTAKRCAAPPPPYSIQSITDKFAYYSGQNRQLELFTYRWPFCDYADHVKLPVEILGRYTVLSDDFFISNMEQKADKYTNRHLDVISFGGHLKFQQTMAKHEFWDDFFAPIRSSEQGNRIAVDIPTLRGGNRTLDLSPHVTARKIVVYDIDAGKELASIPVKSIYQYRFEFDLSPDGHRVAILEDDVVKLVDIE